MREAQARSPHEVLDDHLLLAKEGKVDEDLQRNYAEEVVILSRRGVHRGHEGARYLARLLEQELPSASFEYGTVLVEGEYGFLEWTGHSQRARVRDGADSFVIRSGRIVAQTIHYTVEPV